MGGLAFIDKDLPSTESDRRVDWIGALLVTAGLTLIVFVLSDGEIAPNGWQTSCERVGQCNVFVLILASDIIALLVLGVALVLAFLLWQYYLERQLDRKVSPSHAY